VCVATDCNEVLTVPWTTLIKHLALGRICISLRRLEGRCNRLELSPDLVQESNHIVIQQILARE